VRVRSLRAQLALWHAGLLAVTLVTLAGLTYLVLLRVLHSRADAALARYAERHTRHAAAEAIPGARSAVVGSLRPDR
jgi:hypothetical protein